jgi:hypothetical protein
VTGTWRVKSWSNIILSYSLSIAVTNLFHSKDGSREFNVSWKNHRKILVLITKVLIRKLNQLFVRVCICTCSWFTFLWNRTKNLYLKNNLRHVGFLIYDIVLFSIYDARTEVDWGEYWYIAILLWLRFLAMTNHDAR